MANTSATINIKALFDASDVNSKIAQIRKEFANIKMAPEVSAEFTKIFSNLQNDLANYQNQLDKGFSTKSDANAFNKTIDNISKGFTDLENVIAKLKSDLGDNIDLSNFIKIPDNAKAKINEYTQQIEILQNKLKNLIEADQIKEINNFFNLMSKTSGGKKAALDVKNLIDTGEIDQAVEKLEKLKKIYQDKYNYYHDNGKSTTNTESILSGINGLLTILDQVKIKAIDTRQELEKVQTSKANAISNTVKDLVTPLENSSKAVHTLGENFSNAVPKAKELANAEKDFNSQLDSMNSRIKYFFGLSNAVQLVRNSIREAYDSVKELDAAMTESAVVTKYSVGDMWDQLPKYTAAANELGATTQGAYETMTLFYQQGLNTNEAFAIGTETMKMARIAGLDYATATNYMTAALRGFNMELNTTSATKINDVYSQLAAITASDTQEISVAMTKVASLANSANMEFETTAAFLAQIVETTRESAETAGTALKTVIARFSEVKSLYSEGELTGTDDEGSTVDVNKISKALRTAGIDLNKYFLGEVGLDDIFMELSSKWDSLTNVQQRYIATQAAGSRQQSRFIALMQDYSRMQELVGEAYNSSGASEKQFEKTQDSLESKLNKLSNAWQEFTMGIANNDFIKGTVDALTNLLNLVNKFTSSFGNTWTQLLNIGTIIGGLTGGRKLFGGITSGIGNAVKKSQMGVNQTPAESFWQGFKDYNTKPKQTTVSDITTNTANVNGNTVIVNGPISREEPATRASAETSSRASEIEEIFITQEDSSNDIQYRKAINQATATDKIFDTSLPYIRKPSQRSLFNAMGTASMIDFDEKKFREYYGVEYAEVLSSLPKLQVDNEGTYPGLSFTPQALTETQVDAVFQKWLSPDLADKWFHGDSKQMWPVRNVLSKQILGNDELRNAALNGMYYLYKDRNPDYHDVSFAEFLDTPIDLYRGGAHHGQAEFDSYSLNASTAKSFGTDISHLRLLPSQTVGSIDRFHSGFGETEIFVPMPQDFTSNQEFFHATQPGHEIVKQGFPTKAQYDQVYPKGLQSLIDNTVNNIPKVIKPMNWDDTKVHHELENALQFFQESPKNEKEQAFLDNLLEYVNKGQGHVLLGNYKLYKADKGGKDFPVDLSKYFNAEDNEKAYKYIQDLYDYSNNNEDYSIADEIQDLLINTSSYVPVVTYLKELKALDFKPTETNDTQFRKAIDIANAVDKPFNNRFVAYPERRSLANAFGGEYDPDEGFDSDRFKAYYGAKYMAVLKSLPKLLDDNEGTYPGLDFTPQLLTETQMDAIFYRYLDEEEASSWFHEDNWQGRNHIGQQISENRDLRNAALNNMYFNYKNRRGNENVSFSDFLGTPVDMYRGGAHEGYQSEIDSYSFSYATAHEFDEEFDDDGHFINAGTPSVSHLKLYPSQTLGSVDRFHSGHGENEIFVQMPQDFKDNQDFFKATGMHQEVVDIGMPTWEQYQQALILKEKDRQAQMLKAIYGYSDANIEAFADEVFGTGNETQFRKAINAPTVSDKLFNLNIKTPLPHYGYGKSLVNSMGDISMSYDKDYIKEKFAAYYGATIEEVLASLPELQDDNEGTYPGLNFTPQLLSRTQIDALFQERLNARDATAWFHQSDWQSREDITNQISSDRDLRNAALSNLYYLYTDTFKDVDFDKFLETPIDLYRGGAHYGYRSQYDSYSLEQQTTDNFHTNSYDRDPNVPEVSHLKLYPYQTLGSFDRFHSGFSETETIVEIPEDWEDNRDFFKATGLGDEIADIGLPSRKEYDKLYPNGYSGERQRGSISKIGLDKANAYYKQLLNGNNLSSNWFSGTSYGYMFEKLSKNNPLAFAEIYKYWASNQMFSTPLTKDEIVDASDLLQSSKLDYSIEDYLHYFDTLKVHSTQEPGSDIFVKPDKALQLLTNFDHMLDIFPDDDILTQLYGQNGEEAYNISEISDYEKGILSDVIAELDAGSKKSGKKGQIFKNAKTAIVGNEAEFIAAIKDFFNWKHGKNSANYYKGNVLDLFNENSGNQIYSLVEDFYGRWANSDDSTYDGIYTALYGASKKANLSELLQYLNSTKNGDFKNATDFGNIYDKLINDNGLDTQFRKGGALNSGYRPYGKILSINKNSKTIAGYDKLLSDQELNKNQLKALQEFRDAGVEIQMASNLGYYDSKIGKSFKVSGLINKGKIYASKNASEVELRQIGKHETAHRELNKKYNKEQQKQLYEQLYNEVERKEIEKDLGIYSENEIPAEALAMLLSFDNATQQENDKYFKDNTKQNLLLEKLYDSEDQRSKWGNFFFRGVTKNLRKVQNEGPQQTKKSDALLSLEKEWTSQDNQLMSLGYANGIDDFLTEGIDIQAWKDKIENSQTKQKYNELIASGELRQDSNFEDYLKLIDYSKKSYHSKAAEELKHKMFNRGSKYYGTNTIDLTSMLAPDYEEIADGLNISQKEKHHSYIGKEYNISEEDIASLNNRYQEEKRKYEEEKVRSQSSYNKKLDKAQEKDAQDLRKAQTQREKKDQKEEDKKQKKLKAKSNTQLANDLQRVKEEKVAATERLKYLKDIQNKQQAYEQAQKKVKNLSGEGSVLGNIAAATGLSVEELSGLNAEDFKTQALIGATALGEDSTSYLQTATEALNAFVAAQQEATSSGEDLNEALGDESLDNLTGRIEEAQEAYNDLTNQEYDLTTEEGRRNAEANAQERKSAKLRHGLLIGSEVVSLASSFIANKSDNENVQEIASGISEVAGFAGMAIQTLGTKFGLIATIGYGVFKGLDFLIETDSERLERLSEVAQEASTEATNAKRAYDNLLSAESTHNGLLEQLYQLREGTQEFREQLLETNNQALEMINGYNLQYGQDYTYGSMGEIEFSQNGLKNAEKKYLTKSELAQQQSDIAAYNYNYERYKQDYNDTVKQELKTGKYSDIYDFYYNGSIDEEGNLQIIDAKEIGNSLYTILDTWASDYAPKMIQSDFKDSEGNWITNNDESLVYKTFSEYLKTSDFNFNTGEHFSDEEIEELNNRAAAVGYTDINEFANAYANKQLNTDAYQQAKNAYASFLYSQIDTNDEASSLAAEQLIEEFSIAENMGWEIGEKDQLYNAAEEKIKETFAEEGKDWKNLSTLRREYLEQTGISADSDATVEYLQEQLIILQEKSSLQEEINKKTEEYVKSSEDKQLLNDYKKYTGKKLIGIYQNDNYTKELRDQIKRQWLTKSSNLRQNLELNAGVSGFDTTNFSIEQMDTLNTYVDTISTSIGEKTAASIAFGFKKYLEEEEYNDILSNIDFSSTTSAWKDLQKATENVTDESNNYEKSLRDTFDVLKEEVGGTAGLVQNFYYNNSELLDELIAEAEEGGDLTAEGVEDLIDDCDELADLLEIDGINAEGLAEILEAIADDANELTLENLTSDLLKAVMAASELKQHIQDGFDFVDSFTEVRSEQEFGEWGKTASTTILDALDKGYLQDSQLRQYWSMLFGSEGMEEYDRVMKTAGEMKTNGSSNADVVAYYEKQLKDYFTALESMKENGNFSGLFEYYSKIGKFNGTPMSYKDGTMTFDDTITSYEMAFEELKKATGLADGIIDIMLGDFLTSSPNQLYQWQAADVTKGVDSFVSTLENNGIILKGSIEQFYNMYSDAIKEAYGLDTQDAFIKWFEQENDAQGKILDLSIGWASEDDAYKQLLEATGKVNGYDLFAEAISSYKDENGNEQIYYDIDEMLRILGQYGASKSEGYDIIGQYVNLQDQETGVKPELQHTYTAWKKDKKGDWVEYQEELDQDLTNKSPEQINAIIESEEQAAIEAKHTQQLMDSISLEGLVTQINELEKVSDGARESVEIITDFSTALNNLLNDENYQSADIEGKISQLIKLFESLDTIPKVILDISWGENANAEIMNTLLELFGQGVDEKVLNLIANTTSTGEMTVDQAKEIGKIYNALNDAGIPSGITTVAFSTVLSAWKEGNLSDSDLSSYIATLKELSTLVESGVLKPDDAKQFLGLNPNVQTEDDAIILQTIIKRLQEVVTDPNATAEDIEAAKQMLVGITLSFQVTGLTEEDGVLTKCGELKDTLDGIKDEYLVNIGISEESKQNIEDQIRQLLGQDKTTREIEKEIASGDYSVIDEKTGETKKVTDIDIQKNADGTIDYTIYVEVAGSDGKPIAEYVSGQLTGIPATIGEVKPAEGTEFTLSGVKIISNSIEYTGDPIEAGLKFTITDGETELTNSNEFIKYLNDILSESGGKPEDLKGTQIEGTDEEGNSLSGNILDVIKNEDGTYSIQISVKLANGEELTTQLNAALNPEGGNSVTVNDVNWTEEALGKLKSFWSKLIKAISGLPSEEFLNDPEYNSENYIIGEGPYGSSKPSESTYANNQAYTQDSPYYVNLIGTNYSSEASTYEYQTDEFLQAGTSSTSPFGGLLLKGLAKALGIWWKQGLIQESASNILGAPGIIKTSSSEVTTKTVDEIIDEIYAGLQISGMNISRGEKSTEEAMRELTALPMFTESGNVDLYNRPQVSGEIMRKAGWTDVPANSYSTIYGSTYSREDGSTILVTPILPTGDVLSPEGLDAYVRDYFGSGDQKIDEAGLVIGEYPTLDAAEYASDRLHMFQEAYYSGSSQVSTGFTAPDSDLNSTTDAYEKYNMVMAKAVYYTGEGEQGFGDIVADIRESEAATKDLNTALEKTVELIREMPHDLLDFLDEGDIAQYGAILTAIRQAMLGVQNGGDWSYNPDDVEKVNRGTGEYGSGDLFGDTYVVPEAADGAERLQNAINGLNLSQWKELLDDAPTMAAGLGAAADAARRFANQLARFGEAGFDTLDREGLSNFLIGTASQLGTEDQIAILQQLAQFAETVQSSFPNFVSSYGLDLSGFSPEVIDEALGEGTAAQVIPAKVELDAEDIQEEVESTVGKESITIPVNGEINTEKTEKAADPVTIEYINNVPPAPVISDIGANIAYENIEPSPPTVEDIHANIIYDAVLGTGTSAILAGLIASPAHGKNGSVSLPGFAVGKEGDTSYYGSGVYGGRGAPRTYEGLAQVGEKGPELVVTNDGAYIAGKNGPTVTYVHEDDTIYTADETKRIIGEADVQSLPGFASGYGMGRSTGTKHSQSSGEEDEEPEEWTNEFDWLYNMMEDIRELERIQAKYAEDQEDYLKDQSKTYKDLVKLTRQQLENYYKQKDSQEEVLKLRNQEMQNYMTDNGDMTKYGWYNFEDKTLEINWDLIDAIKDKDTYEDVEEYIDKLEDIQDKIEDTEDTIMDIDNSIQELQLQYQDDYLDFEQRIYDAIVQLEQDEIDAMSEASDAIQDSNEKLLDNVSKAIDKQREARENEDTEEELAKQERRLNYLRQDTSGSNLKEIQELEEELKENREDYYDDLVDQKLDLLSEQEDIAAEQRERQIELLQNQLDWNQENGVFWQDAYTMFLAAFDSGTGIYEGSYLEEVLKKVDNYAGMSEEQQKDWMSTLQENAKTSRAYWDMAYTIGAEDTGLTYQVDVLDDTGNILRTIQGEVQRQEKADSNNAELIQKIYDTLNKNSEYQKYISYDSSSNTLTIDDDAIKALSDTNLQNKLYEAIDSLEAYQDQINGNYEYYIRGIGDENNPLLDYYNISWNHETRSFQTQAKDASSQKIEEEKEEEAAAAASSSVKSVTEAYGGIDLDKYKDRYYQAYKKWSIVATTIANYRESADYYSDLIDSTNNEISNLESKITDLNSQLRNARTDQQKNTILNSISSATTKLDALEDNLAEYQDMEERYSSSYESLVEQQKTNYQDQLNARQELITNADEATAELIKKSAKSASDSFNSDGGWRYVSGSDGRGGTVVVLTANSTTAKAISSGTYDWKNDPLGFNRAKGGMIGAYASGGSYSRRGHAGMSLTGEEGPEMVWNKEGGYAYITGQNGPQMADLKPGDHIFNANETSEILRRPFMNIKNNADHFMSNAAGTGGTFSTSSDTYNITIEANISDDYSVEQMIEKVKKEIYRSSEYRNVNIINRLR